MSTTTCKSIVFATNVPFPKHHFSKNIFLCWKGRLSEMTLLFCYQFSRTIEANKENRKHTGTQKDCWLSLQNFSDPQIYTLGM